MNEDPDFSKKMQELQSLEQLLQTTLMQKQNLQVELNEIENALSELSQSDEEVYKIISGMMIKSDKKKLALELEEKKKIFSLKISSIESHELKLSEKTESLREELSKFFKSS